MSIPLDERVSVARQVLLETLKENGPQLGAKLKVRLSAALGRRLGLPPDRWHSLIPRLSHFLAAHSDLVQVERPTGPGDIRVSLRDEALLRPDLVSELPHVWYRPDVWMAFVNPDPLRRRFFNRRTQEIVHFVAQSSTPPNPELARRIQDDPAFVEIQLADSATQNTWMREFLETPVISEAQKKVARHFVEVPFESSINTAFAVSLGPHADTWRRFRVRKIADHIRRWSERTGITIASLKSFRPAAETTDAGRLSVETGQAASTPVQELAEKSAGDLRSTLRSIVELLDDSELRFVLVPLSAVERILRPRS